MAKIESNIDSIITQLAKMEKAVATEVIRVARAKMRALMRSSLPEARSNTPVGKTGNLAKSPKVKSRSRRGVSTASVIWDIKQNQAQTETVLNIGGVKVNRGPKKKKKFFNYAGVVNFKKNQSGQKFASDLWERNKPILDQEGLKLVQESFREVLTRHGVKFK